MMPEINGLQLVAAVRENYPKIPIILMTSQGSEEIAVQALQQGASSYVPKRLLMRYLWDTIEKVLKAAVEDRGQARLLHVHVADRKHLSPGERSRIVRAIDPLSPGGNDPPGRLHRRRPRPRRRGAGGSTDQRALPRQSGARFGGPQPARLSRTGAAAAAQPGYSERRIEVEARITRNEAAFAIRDEGMASTPRNCPTLPIR